MIKAHQPAPGPAAEVTLYPNIRATKNGHVHTLDKIMSAIASGRWKEKIEAVRDGSGDKKNLPYFTGSGTFSQRKESGLLEHNRRIVIDIDNHDPDEIKSLVGAGPDPFIEYCFTSCKGKGVGLIFKINPDKHKESFEAISNYLLTEYGLSADIAVKDISRARFVSYDPDLLHNPNAETFAVAIGAKADPVAIACKMVQKSTEGERHIMLLRAARLLGGYVAGGGISRQDAESSLANAFTARPYDKDYNYGGTIKDGLNYGKDAPIDPAKQQIYHIARAKNRDGVKLKDKDLDAYIYELAEEMPGSVEDNLKNVKAIFAETYNEHQDEHNDKKKTAIAKAESFIDARYILKRNEITRRIEQWEEMDRGGKSGAWVNCNVDTIYRALQHHGVTFGLDKVKSLMKSDFVPDYNPFTEYFEGLPDFAGIGGDPIGVLASHIRVRGDNKYFRTMLEKMLVRCIGCGLGDHENRTVFVLVGEKQNTGKSSFVRFLNPFGNKYYTEAPLRDNKDTEFSFSENFIYNLEELNALSNIEINKLKAIISKTVVKERRAYAADAEDEIRRCNFFGSTNKDDFLTDDSNTRWLCFYVESINFDYSNKETGKSAVSIRDVWAQAWNLYNDPGYNAQLTLAESGLRDEINKSYEVNTVEKDVINRIFISDESHLCEFFSKSEVIELMVEKTLHKHKFNPRIIAKSMRQLGFIEGSKKINGTTTRGFYARIADFTTKKDIENTDNDPDQQKIF